ncbi:MAG: hypothetical protein KDD82_23405 [Planctomycetes bacterium]|nr:hypothetical protein [Planctomycetota bacterium]
MSEDASLQIKCEGCGAELTYAVGTTSLECQYCGATQEIGSDSPEGEDGPGKVEIVEYDFHEGLAKLAKQKSNDLVEGGQEFECKGCGATEVIKGQASECSYCGSPIVVTQKPSEDMLVPESVLPFKIDDRKSRDLFHKWVEGLWFAPNDLKQRASADRIDGVYMPYWTYDSHTTTRYRGQRGDHYYVSESYTDSEGNRKTRQVRKTRWRSASGTVRVPFDDVLVYASKSLERPLVEKLEPWPLKELKPYQPAYLSGFKAERYRIGLKEGFKLAEQRMEPKIRSAVRRDIGGDEQRIYSLAISHDNVTFKHFLLPLWISSFRYNEKLYRFLVNACTGEVVGKRPYSWIKITLLVLAILAVIVGIVVAVQMSKAHGA